MSESPGWARGFPLDFLKEAAGLYREEFKPHTYGAFGLPKERDVADALHDGALIWARSLSGNKPLAALAIAKPVQRPSPHEDFAGRRVVLQAGSVFVKSIAGTDEGKRRILGSVLAHAPTAWVEAHVENPATVAVLSAAGFRHIVTKVSASSDLKGMFARGDVLAPEPLHPADEPSVKVLRHDFITQAETAAICQELEALGGAAFAQHYSSYNKRQSWTAVALRGFDPADPGFIAKPAEMSRAWKDTNPARLAAPCEDTTAAPLFPTVWEVLKRLPVARVQRVRFMRLSAKGGELTRHADITDPEAGTAEGKVARLHIPITTEPGCLFRAWGLEGAESRLHMPARSLSYIDTRKPHAVVNPAAMSRIHLVVDAFSTPELRAWLST